MVDKQSEFYGNILSAVITGANGIIRAISEEKIKCAKFIYPIVSIACGTLTTQSDCFIARFAQVKIDMPNNPIFILSISERINNLLECSLCHSHFPVPEIPAEFHVKSVYANNIIARAISRSL